MHRFVHRFVLVTLRPAWLCALLGWPTGCQQTAKPDSATPTAVAVAESKQNATSTVDRVTAGPPIRKTMQLFTEQPGRVAAFEEAPILSKLPGYVDAVHCDIGDQVKKGQLLIRLHAPEYQDQLEQKHGLLVQADSQIKQAEAALVAAEAAVHSAQALVSQTQAGVGKSEAEIARWQSEFNRVQQLVSKGSVTPKLADETASQLKTAEAVKQEALAIIDSAKAKQREAEATVLTAKADFEASKAKRAVVQSEISQAETMLTYTSLVAPFDGCITSRKVDAGHYVQPAGSSTAQPLVTIANLNKVRIFVHVPESEAGWIDANTGNANTGNAESGDTVTVTSALLPGKPLEARVTRTSSQLDPQSHSLLVEIDIDNQDRLLLPGAYVTAKIILEQREEVLALPTGAIIKANDRAHCALVVDGKIQLQPVELGMRVGEEIEIKSGLSGTETVVLARAAALKDGQPVEVMKKK